VIFFTAALVLFSLSGYLVQYLVLWILPLVRSLQAILRLRAISEHRRDHRFFLAAHRGAHPRRAGLARVADLSPPRELPHRAPSLRLGAHYNLRQLHREDGRAGVLDRRGVVPSRSRCGRFSRFSRIACIDELTNPSLR